MICTIKMQGEIDWPALRSQGIEFAYIKATEGSGSVDERFDQNLRGVMDVGLPVELIERDSVREVK